MLQFVYHGVSDPDGIKRVFVDNAENYRRPDLVKRLLRPAIGESLFNAEDESWRGQRRMLAPVFSPHVLSAFMPLFADVAERSAARLSTRGLVVDMAEEATRTTLEVIDQALFSGESGMSFDETSAHVRDFMAGSTEVRLALLLGLEALDMGPAQRKARRARGALVRRMAAFIRGRTGGAAAPEDFVGRLYAAFLEEHPPEEAVQLTIDNAMTFFVAGHETTANGLAWALYLLSGDPQAQAWAREEARAAWAAAGDDPDALLARLPYLKMVWDETLRLYPPVHRIERQAEADDELCGQPIRRGEMISVWPWVVHRHRTLWAEPDVFNPENFDPEGRQAMHRYQYIPFGAGPRVCIGMGFAQSEALIVLSRWLCEYGFAPVRDRDVRPQGDFSLRPEGGLPLVVERLDLWSD
jgi:cytochrome P450